MDHEMVDHEARSDVRDLTTRFEGCKVRCGTRCAEFDKELVSMNGRVAAVEQTASQITQDLAEIKRNTSMKREWLKFVGPIVVAIIMALGAAWGAWAKGLPALQQSLETSIETSVAAAVDEAASATRGIPPASRD